MAELGTHQIPALYSSANISFFCQAAYDSPSSSDSPSRSLGGVLTLLFLTALLVVAPVQAQEKSLSDSLEAKTVIVSYEVFAGNKTPNEARDKAVDRAQAEAVRKAIGTQVQAEQRTSTVETGKEVVDRFSQVVRTQSSGRVVETKVLEDEMIDRGGELFYHVRIEAQVVPNEGIRDPGFEVFLSLKEDDGTYVARGSAETSDEIIAKIQTTRDAHVRLFSVTADTLQVIWPNSIAESHFIPKDTTVEFPSPSLRARGLHVRVTLPSGRTQRTERLVAVATKQDVPFQPVPDYRVRRGELETAQASLEAFNRWLVDIPLSQRALATVSYIVRAPDASTTRR